MRDRYRSAKNPAGVCLLLLLLWFSVRPQTGKSSRCCVVCTESIRESGGKVLIHCRAGISRSATVCIAYLMYAGRLTLDEAFDYLKRCRPLISPNLNFMRQLAEFESCLTSSGQVGLRRPAPDLVASIVSHCSSQSRPAYRKTSADAEETPTKPRNGPEVENWPGKKRKAQSDLMLPCAPSAAKIARAGLQPPPTPCMKQTFVFDFATVAVLMSSHASAGSPPMSQSPLVSPS